METGGRDRVAHRGGDLAHGLGRAEHLAGIGAADGQPRDEVGALGRSRAHGEPLIELGEHEVVPAARLGAGAHRGAEAGRRCGAAVDRDDERIPAPGAVVLVRVRPAEEHAVLDPQGGELAGADAQERQRGRVHRRGLERHGTPVAAAHVERHDGREGPPLGAERPHGVVEHAPVAIRHEAVVARRLLVADAGGQVVDRGDLRVHDGPVHHAGPDDRAAVLVQEVDEHAQVRAGKEPWTRPVDGRDRHRRRGDRGPGRRRVRRVGHALVDYHGTTSLRRHSSRANRSSSWRRVAASRRLTAWSTRG